MNKTKKIAKPFFLEDSNGTIYKATKIADEDIPLDETEEVLEEEMKKDEESEAEVAVMLSAGDFEILKQLIAERKEMHDAEDKDKKDEDKKDEDKKDDKVEDGCDDEDEKVVDTKSKDSVDGFGSIEQQDVKIDDSEVDKQSEIAAAWKKRYSGNN